MGKEAEETPEDKSLSLEELNEAFQKVSNLYWQNTEKLEERIERQEGMLALLAQGFAEVASSAEAMMQTYSEKFPEDTERLRQNLIKVKEKMIDVLNSHNTKD